MAPSVEELAAVKAGTGEGPHWDIKSQSLFIIDVHNVGVMRYHPESKKVYSLKLDVPSIGFIIPVAGAKDQFVIGAGLDLKILHWDGISDKEYTLEHLLTLKDELDTNRINDAKVDPTGRLFFGTMTKIMSEVLTRWDGSFYSYSKSEGLKKHLANVAISNGIAWDESKGVMYYNDTLSKTVDALDWDKSGCKGNRRPIFDYRKHNLECYPDGITIDTDRNLWVACYSGGRVLQIDPSSGKLLQEVMIPTKNVTSVAWGGPQLSDLYVTTGSDAGDPKAGSTFRVTGLGAKGLPMEEFKL